MKLTKYEHACVVLEDGGKKLVIDPGMFTQSLTDLTNVVGLVITHVHEDHFDKVLVDKILAANPEAKVFTVQAVADQLAGKNVQVVKAGDTVKVGPFELTFYGRDHALVHASIPKVDNVGVMVNKTFYYPGDSFTTPDGAAVDVLAVPVSAPWLKTGESMDFLAAIKPRIAFPTHNGLHNDIAESISNQMLGSVAQSLGTEYKVLAANESLTI